MRHCLRSAILMFLCPILCIALRIPVHAIQVHSDDIYRFISSDFTTEPNQLIGIFFTQIPSEGTIRLGERQIRPGDAIPVQQIDQLVFHAPSVVHDTQAVLSCIPVFTRHSAPETAVTISISGKQNQPPTVEDSRIETYKNIPNSARLKATDPEGQPLCFTLTQPPKRGSVRFCDNGTFVYTPQRNKVGTDLFCYIATDPAGNCSRQASVTVEIRNPADSQPYIDTAGRDCRFAAEWLRDTGIFSAESINGIAHFQPDKPVSRGQFLSMLMQTLDMPVSHSAGFTGFVDTAPDWLKPYLSAAFRSGLVQGYPTPRGMAFRPWQSITVQEAAAMSQRAADLAMPVSGKLDFSTYPVSSDSSAFLTRSDAAILLYRLRQVQQRRT